jgi:lipid II:glycine glycyltransferase (peptidoglycan interpeptide bridge formation enzyme)
MVPAMEISSPFTGKRGVSLPFSDRVAPLVDDQNRFDRMFEAMIKYGSRNGWQSITFQGGNGFFRPDQSYTAYIGSSIDLDGSSRSLYKKFRSNTRRNIKKAENSGLETSIVQTQDGNKAFYRLNCLTRKDHGLPPQPYSFFERIQEHLFAKGSGFVCLALNNKEPVAGVVFLHFNQTAIYKFGASDKQFFHLRPNNLSMWHAIRWYADKDFQTLDLGRSDMDHHGLLQFKRSWNSNENLIHYYKYDIRQKQFLKKKPAIKSSYWLFRRLPVPVLKIIGQVLYRHVG